MSSNMQRQAVPLSRSEKCIVGTGLKRQAAFDSRALAIAEHEAKIIYTDTDKIVLSGKLTPQMVKESSYAPKNRLLRAILGIQVSTSKETCLKLPTGGRGRVIDVRWIQKKRGSSYNPEMIRVYMLQKREIKVGNKVAGRHGNKGIISKILPRQDMPYLQDRRPVDMVFNPLGVPSRMNVGHIFECSLGLAGSLLDRHYQIAPFDERYEQEASRKLVFFELYEASKQTANPWVFEPEYPGKSRIFAGRTGDPFEQPVLIGKPYILKLIHQVDDKIHGRSSGHYALVTRQPLRGRAKQGGQWIGEMEIRNEKLSSQSIQLGCPGYDMSHRRSNRKLRIMGVFNTPK
ncbi:DNA-directed RNA polymerase subunit beta [Camellia lanceoleosa]|uniref:DNA-directed RNA polymerase subunit beta n=1 Tax=Camellia lanceoleosa TaxID=1840588 RepID=A0ACC0GES5_9ERIC|nr:DNA-directed RNA polymerase subunit beta [Camellia lanceoleosa]